MHAKNKICNLPSSNVLSIFDQSSFITNNQNLLQLREKCNMDPFKVIDQTEK